MHSLPLFVRLTGRNVILIGDGEAAQAKRRLLDRAGAIVVAEDAVAVLAIVAVEDDAEAEAAVARLRSRGILVNAVDRAALCDFTLPAIVDRAPVLIAIGTGGASAGLAKALRQRLEALLPQSLGELALALKELRTTLRTRFPDAVERRYAINGLLSEGGPADPLNPSLNSVRAELVETLSCSLSSMPKKDSPLRRSSGQASTSSGRTEHIRLTSSNPDDLTLRQARQLASATTIYHNADIPVAILDRARADATRILGDAPQQAGNGLTLILKLSSPRT